MSLTIHSAKNLVTWMDGLFRPRPDEVTAVRADALATELVAAFAGTDAKETNIHGLVVQWRRAMDDSENERIRAATRPSGWDLRRSLDQLQRAVQQAQPAKGCQDCHDTGRQVIMAVLWRNALLRVQPLVVACSCGQGDTFTMGGVPALKRASWWRTAAREGAARFQDDPVAMVVEAHPVYGDVALRALSGLGVGEIVDDNLWDEVERAVLHEC